MTFEDKRDQRERTLATGNSISITWHLLKTQITLHLRPTRFRPRFSSADLKPASIDLEGYFIYSLSTTLGRRLYIPSLVSAYGAQRDKLQGLVVLCGP